MKYGKWLFLLASFLISSSASLPESQSINFRQTSREKFGCFKFYKYASTKTPGRINCWWKYFVQFEKTTFFNIWLRNWRCNMWIYILHFCHWIIMIMLMGNSLQNLTYRGRETFNGFAQLHWWKYSSNILQPSIKSGLMALLLLLLSNCSKESAIYIFVKNVIQKLSQLSLPHSLTLDMLNNQI